MCVFGVCVFVSVYVFVCVRILVCMDVNGANVVLLGVVFAALIKLQLCCAFLALLRRHRRSASPFSESPVHAWSNTE